MRYYRIRNYLIRRFLWKLWRCMFIIAIPIILAATVSAPVNAGKQIMPVNAGYITTKARSISSERLGIVSDPAAAIPKLDISNTAELVDNPGMNGRLYIPSKNMSVTLYNADPYHQPVQCQNITDNADSAAIFDYFFGGGNRQVMITDHTEQAFSVLHDRDLIGKLAYIVRGDTEYVYMCTSVNPNAVNSVTAYTDAATGAPIPLPGGDSILMITCNDSSGISVTIAQFDKICER